MPDGDRATHVDKFIYNKHNNYNMVYCARCSLQKVRHGKKMVQKLVVMNEGMIMATCPECGFQCRPYDSNINDPQPHIKFPNIPMGK